MVDDSDRQRARGGLEKTLRGLDSLEQNLRSCSDAQLSETLRDIERRKARQSAALLSWLGLGGADLQSDLHKHSAETASEDQKLRRDNDADIGSQAPRVLERRDITEDLLQLKVQKPADFDFLPGQSTKLELEGISRRYSIASAPHEGFLEFFIELVPGGEMSQVLRTLTGGEQVTLETPKGSFLLDEQFSNHLMIATVTGVSPFVSMLRHSFAGNRAAPTDRFVVLHGASYQDEFGYDAELERLANAHEQFDYIPTISRPGEARNAGWTGEQGRVGTLVEATIQVLGLDPSSTCLYACGHSGMVDEVAEIFGSQGFTVKREVYD